VSTWTSVCALGAVLPDAGACALVDGRQIAVFRAGEAVFALDNFDPAGKANVLSRGIVGDVKGELAVASPLYKQHFSLATGRCLEDPAQSVNVYPVRVMDGRIWVSVEPQRLARARRRRLVVVGNGMAGMRVVEQLLEIAPQAYEVTVLGAEPHVNYNRILLSPVLAGEKRVEDIVVHPREWYEEHGVALHAGDPAVSIDRRRRVVRSRGGLDLPYDRLLLATGSRPVMLPIPGAQLPGVVTFRDLADVDSMLQAASRYRRAAVIGGGLLGLEAAHGLARRGMDVTVVHRLETLMERQLDAEAGRLLQAALESRGLRFLMRASTVAVAGCARATGLIFEDGSGLEADLVVMAAGIVPNVELARGAGLRCERGILVDDTMQTYDPSVYAVGECVQHRNQTFGLIAPLWDQARVCASHLADHGVRRFRGALSAAQLKVSGIELYSAGDFAAAQGGESLVLRDRRRGLYKRLVVRDSKLRGVVLYGDARHGPWYFDLMSTGEDIGPLRDQLLFGPSAGAGSGERREAG
jgi:nitrite reductase [NAD(P)H] large subunit